MASRRRRRNEQAPGWAWLLLGLSIGLGVALVVYLRSGYEPIGSAPTGTGAAATAARSAPAPTPPPKPSANAASSAEPAATKASAEPKASGDASTEPETEYAFFDLLPESEVTLPESPRNAGAAPASPREFVVQAGSFKAREDADRVKARLALLNIASAIQPAIVGDQIYYRVIIGPLSDRAEIDRVLRRLRAERIDWILSPR